MKETERNIISTEKRVRAVAAVFILAASLMSFTLPREFFDPHAGFEYDIFCVSFDAISTDELFIPVPPYVAPPAPETVSVSFNEIILSQYTDQLKNSRAPPFLLI